MKSSAQIRNSAIIVVMFQAIQYIIPLIILPLLVLKLGVGAYGEMAFAQAFAQYFVIFVDAGFNLTAARLIAIRSKCHYRVSSIFWNTCALRLGLFLFSLLVFFVLLNSFEMFSDGKWLFIWSFLNVLGSMIFPVWFFIGKEALVTSTIIQVIARVVVAGLILFYVDGPEDLMIATIIQSSSVILSGIISWFLIFGQYRMRWCWPSWRMIVYLWRRSYQFFLSDFYAMALSNSSVFMVGIYATKEAVGMFSALEKIVKAGIGGIFPLYQVVFSRISCLFNQDFLVGHKICMRYLIVMWVLGGLGVLTAWFLGDWVISLIFQDSLGIYGGKLLFPFSIWLVFMAISLFLGQVYLLGSGNSALYAKAQFLGSNLYLIVLMLISYFSADFVWMVWEIQDGAYFDFVQAVFIAIAMIIGEGFLVSLLLLKVRKIWKSQPCV